MKNRKDDTQIVNNTAVQSPYYTILLGYYNENVTGYTSIKDAVDEIEVGKKTKKQDTLKFKIKQYMEEEDFCRVNQLDKESQNAIDYMQKVYANRQVVKEGYDGKEEYQKMKGLCAQPGKADDAPPAPPKHQDDYVPQGYSAPDTNKLNKSQRKKEKKQRKLNELTS